jgi:hypothetical protein
MLPSMWASRRLQSMTTQLMRQIRSASYWLYESCRISLRNTLKQYVKSPFLGANFLQCWMKHKTTRYAQLSKYRDLWSKLADWRATLPVYLDWTKYNSALATHVYLRMQRPYLETQFQCLKMKVSWSIAHLDPLLMMKFQSIWDVGDANDETLQAGQRVLTIIDENGAPSDGYRFYHWEAIRATMTLSQMLLRHDVIDGQRSVTETLQQSCQHGLTLCRKLVPPVLARVENTIQSTLEE